ncbi:MAG TPA: Zn-ribbon domain-containing OB-fold protein, partial [Actinoplanes sp.]|nr:Zn-ribbon domain-containing OB-fold protein [Actinoplanes sp.]
RIIGQRCPACRKVYVPPRVCPADGVAPGEVVDIADRGTVTTFCVVNVPFAGQRLTPPYVVAQVLLDGADIPIPHLILGVPAAEVRMGQRVAAVWRDRSEWSTTPENIDHFEPSGEPDAPFETYAEHL